jgi:hypothetical protein
VDVGLDELIVHGRENAPMPPRMVVMNSMVSVVVAKEVQNRRDEVAGVVVLMFLVAAVMLQHVQRDDAKFGVEMRQEAHKNPLFPIKNHEHCCGGEKNALLQLHLLVDWPVRLALHCKVRLVVGEHIGSNSNEEKQAVEKVPLISHFGRAHHVLRRLRVLVMRKVVAWDVVTHRVTVSQTLDYLKCIIDRRVVEHWAVNGVVNRHSTHEREMTQGAPYHKPFQPAQLIVSFP